MVIVYYKGTPVCNLNSLAEAETYVRWEIEICGLGEEDFRVEITQ